MIELNILARCQNCPEFNAETRKEVIYGDTEKVVNTEIICENRGLCDRIFEHLEETRTSRIT